MIIGAHAIIYSKDADLDRAFFRDVLEFPSIDAYLAGVGDARRRAVLERLRATLHAALPGAVECISYGMPAFRFGGRVVAGVQATSSGCSFYPFSGSTLDALGDALEGFVRTKSALHFDAARPLSPARSRSSCGPGSRSCPPRDPAVGPRGDRERGAGLRRSDES